MFSLIASGIIIGSASYSDEFREMVKNNSFNAYLKCSEYFFISLRVTSFALTVFKFK